MRLEWREDNNSLKGFTGKYKAFSIFYDEFSSKGNTKKIKLVCFLHGIKSELGYHVNYDEAREYAEKSLNLWLNGLTSENYNSTLGRR